MTIQTITQFAEIKQVVQEIGFLPLSGFIPDYPSLESLTPAGNWHTDSEADPWRWRVQLAEERIVAYGKFFKKKPVFISLELFPYFRSCKVSRQSIEERYHAGQVSRTAYLIYQTIEAKGLTDARTLRSLVGMREKEQKSTYEKALVELQESFDLVITGSAYRMNEEGNKSGWNSMSFELTDRWFAGMDQVTAWHEREQAEDFLLQFFEPRCSSQAFAYLQKLLKS